MLFIGVCVSCVAVRGVCFFLLGAFCLLLFIVVCCERFELLLAIVCFFVLLFVLGIGCCSVLLVCVDRCLLFVVCRRVWFVVVC